METDEVKVPKSPDDWVEPSPNTAKGGNTFKKLDSPGTRSSFSYCPIFAPVAKVIIKKFHFTHLAAIQFLQTNTALQFVHTEGGIFLPRAQEGGIQGWCEGEH